MSHCRNEAFRSTARRILDAANMHGSYVAYNNTTQLHCHSTTLSSVTELYGVVATATVTDACTSH